MHTISLNCFNNLHTNLGIFNLNFAYLLVCNNVRLELKMDKLYKIFKLLFLWIESILNFIYFLALFVGF